MSFLDHEVLRGIAEAQRNAQGALVLGGADVFVDSCLADLSDPVLRRDAAAALAGYFATSATQPNDYTGRLDDLGHSFPIAGIVIA